ncbi:MAG: hypothetical protein IK999_12905 [Ruminococcus sp.]|nr:hypothetical protein [Ruminococcus sp.]
MTTTERTNMENLVATEIYRINSTCDYPTGTKMLECYAKDMEYLSATELYELQDALRVVDDES